MSHPNLNVNMSQKLAFGILNFDRLGLRSLESKLEKSSSLCGLPIKPQKTFCLRSWLPQPRRKHFNRIMDYLYSHRQRSHGDVRLTCVRKMWVVHIPTNTFLFWMEMLATQNPTSLTVRFYFLRILFPFI